MSNVSAKRILSDINDLKKNPLDDEGIYLYVDDNNIYNIKSLIIGPKDTPYEGGFYFFDFNIPKTYPIDPPKVKYCTQYKNVRFNPNLYKCGKICLSMLNTWNGPSWTPCNTLRSILLSFLGLVFIKYPLTNEPGYEFAPTSTLDEYNMIIEHESLRGACINILNNIPSGFEVFKDTIEKYFIKNYDNYIEKIVSNIDTKNNKQINASIYNMELCTNYNNILDDFQNIYKNISNNI
jgi:ubiquitin-conjugating enzyme E2 Z